jgi:hypothetical protein
MTSLRTPRHRQRHGALTSEMVELFKRGCELQAQWAGIDDDDAEKPGYDEFVQISKRLDWTLLHRPGEVSVFDSALDDEEMRPVHLYCGGASWDDGVALRKALLAAIAP